MSEPADREALGAEAEEAHRAQLDGAEVDEQAAAELEEAAAALVEAWLAAEGDRPVVSGAQLRALGVIEHQPGLSLAELADRLGTIASWASRLCDRLEADGYIERLPASHGRRRLELYLRPAGRDVLDAIRRRRRHAVGRTLAAMTASERRSLMAGLRAYSWAAAPRDRTGRGLHRTA